MSYKELNADAKYLPGQPEERQSREEGGEFNLAWDRFRLTEQTGSEQRNQIRIFNQLEEEAIAEGDFSNGGRI